MPLSTTSSINITPKIKASFAHWESFTEVGTLGLTWIVLRLYVLSWPAAMWRHKKLLFIWLCLNWLIDYDRWYTRLLYVLTLFEDVGLDLPEYVAHLAAGHSSRGMGRLWTTRAVTNKLTTIGWQTVVPSLVGYWFAAKKLRWTDPPPPPPSPPLFKKGSWGHCSMQITGLISF